MIPISTTMSEYIEESSVWDIQMDVTIQYGTSTISTTLYKDDLVDGSLSIKYGICDVGQFSIGGTIATEIEFTLINFDGRFDNLDFSNGEVTVRIYMPSDTTEYINLGTFYLDDQKSISRTIKLTGYDAFGTGCNNMNKTLEDSDYSGTWSGYSCRNIIETMASHCGINGTIVSDVPDSIDYTLPDTTIDTSWTPREVIRWCCEVCGCYAFLSNSGSYYNSTYYPSDFRNTDDIGIIVRPYSSYNYTDNVDGGRYVSGDFEVSFSDGVATYEGDLDTYTTSSYTVTISEDGFTYVGDDYTFTTPFTIVMDTSSGIATVTPDTYDATCDDLDGGSFESLPAGDNAEGGYFAWLDTTNTAYTIDDATEITKIMDIPQTNAGRITITGVYVKSYESDTTVFVGDTSGYNLSVEGNPFIVDSNLSEVATLIYEEVDGVNFVPFQLNCLTNPIIEVGDMVKYDDNGITRGTIVTSYDMGIGSLSTMLCEADTTADTVQY